jgi:hypothetical protein
MPAPFWAVETALEIPTPHLEWEGCVVVTVPGRDKPHAIVEVRALVDDEGRIRADKWASTLAAPDGDEDEYEDHPEPIEGLGDRWQRFADQTWVETRVRALVAAKARAEMALEHGMLTVYSSREEARQVVGRAGALLHAYSCPDAVRPAALRLAMDWSGTEDEFIEVLPSVLD